MMAGMKVLCLIFALTVQHDGTVRQDVYEKDFGTGPEAAALCEKWKYQAEFQNPVTGADAEHYVCVQYWET